MRGQASSGAATAVSSQAEACRPPHTAATGVLTMELTAPSGSSSPLPAAGVGREGLEMSPPPGRPVSGPSRHFDNTSPGDGPSSQNYAGGPPLSNADNAESREQCVSAEVSARPLSGGTVEETSLGLAPSPNTVLRLYQVRVQEQLFPTRN